MSKIFVFLLALGISIFALISAVDVTVCHRTGSATNPYTHNVVSVHSVDDATGLNGHGNHPEDAWLPFVFNDVQYPGQNAGLFGTLIGEDCNLLAPPTSTPTLPPTATDTQVPPTDTQVPPTSTSTNEPFPTPTYTNTPTATPTNTDPPTPTGTFIPTNTPTKTPTNIPTETPTNMPTETPTNIPDPTETPRPPVPAESNSRTGYKGDLLGTVYMDGRSYELYQGVNAPDGTLALPSVKRGAALFNNTIWVHRVWNSGWLNLKVGETVMILRDGKFSFYKIIKSEDLPYGDYPKGDNLYVATCMSTDGISWTNVELFTLESLNNRAR